MAIVIYMYMLHRLKANELANGSGSRAPGWIGGDDLGVRFGFHHLASSNFLFVFLSKIKSQIPLHFHQLLLLASE